MYDKTIRRRRAVLALLVVSSLVLLTAYFGESSGGALHSLQRGVGAVAAPFEEGASRIAKPFRDTFSWFGDTIEAKGNLKDVREQRNAWQQRALAAENAAREAQQLRQLRDLGVSNAASEPVNARVIVQSPTLWYSSIHIDKGTSAGIHRNDPVMASDGRDGGAGLIGIVSEAARNVAKITLITDRSVSVGATVAKRSVRGVLQASVGDPGTLSLQFLGPDDIVTTKDYVVTSGTTTSRSELESKYPQGLPIGRVSKVTEVGTDAVQVKVKPFVDMRRVEFVQVLTEKVNGNR